MTPTSMTPTPVSTVNPAGEVEVCGVLKQPRAFNDHRQRYAQRYAEAGQNGAGEGHADAHEAQAAEDIGHAPGRRPEVRETSDLTGTLA